MHRRWLIVALCFCAFSGCVSCQSNYDYCGPMPDEGGDFMYRKNSILGGDPSMPLADEANQDRAAQEAGAEDGAEPTPAPPPDEIPGPGLDFEGDDGSDMLPSDGEPQAGDDEAGESETDEELTDGDGADAESEMLAETPVSTLQWHAPSAKPATSPIKQVRFR
jgi:hypothetical protein